MSEKKLYSVVFECKFVESAFCQGEIYSKGETDYFTVVFFAESFLIAVDKALDYAADNFPNCDVSINSIIRVCKAVIK